MEGALPAQHHMEKVPIFVGCPSGENEIKDPANEGLYHCDYIIFSVLSGQIVTINRLSRPY